MIPLDPLVDGMNWLNSLDSLDSDPSVPTAAFDFESPAAVGIPPMY